MSNREIEQKILNYDIEICELEEYIDDNFENVVKGMIGALYVLLKKSKKNENKIQDIFKELEYIVEEEKNQIRLTLIGQLIDTLNKRIESTFNNKNKNDISVVRDRMLKITNLIKDKEKNKKYKNVVSILEKIIYKDKEIDKIEAILGNKKNLEYSQFEQVLVNILEKYCVLSNEEDIKYYYKVIMILIKGHFSNEISKQKNKFLDILKLYNDKKHVQLLAKRFQDIIITVDELIDKYDVSYNNNLLYIKQDTNICEYMRHDYRYQKVFTIDDEGNECNDDALYIEKNKDGTYTLYIHISDVPSLIKKDDYLDLRAYKNAETIYLRDSEFTMYPENVSNNIGSLLEGKTRNVITYKYLITPHFEIDLDSFIMKRGVIKVDRCLSYNNVDKRLQREDLNDLNTRLKALDFITTILKNNNIHKDIYRAAENKTTGKKTNSLIADKSNAAKIVQEMMILVNSSVDRYFVDRGYPYIHRIHNAPTSEIDQDIMLLLGIDRKTLLNNPKCARILKAVKEKYLNAEYSSISSSHHGLGTNYYSHSTSPLRRYADALGQYIMYDIVFNNRVDDKTIYYWENVVKEVCPYLNERIKNNALFASEYNYLVSKRKIRKK
mgnify:CR=1 FL=1